jgi:hypothetical protein
MVKAGSAKVVDGRRALLSGLFATLLVGAIAFLVLRIVAIAIFLAFFIGFPVGFAASFGTKLNRTLDWSMGLWGIFSAVVQPELLIVEDFGGLTANYFLAQLALFVTIVSIAGFTAGCSQIVCRAIPPRVGSRQPFQYTLREVLVLSFLFATCFAFGAWFAKLDAVQIDRHRSVAAHPAANSSP